MNKVGGGSACLNEVTYQHGLRVTDESGKCLAVDLEALRRSSSPS